MKKILTIFTFLLIAMGAIANGIDSLQTKEAVQQFLRTRLKKIGNPFISSIMQMTPLPIRKTPSSK
ncbi:MULTISPECIES: hypothetical protein [Niastella]|uniref:Uncharacterized protein n=1 Tax=Niastella soli TaxID=2821487 RepID=A0ABS3YZ41_9BACT|nr:hypothetical protein [Niastella soli]MBO9203192.1 hypothetical protein [Niastella soli]